MQPLKITGYFQVIIEQSQLKLGFDITLTLTLPLVCNEIDVTFLVNCSGSTEYRDFLNHNISAVMVKMGARQIDAEKPVEK